MRKFNFRFTTTILSFVFIGLLCATINKVAAAEQEDFDDDGIVEEVPDENLSAVTDENGEELVYESPQYDPKKFHFVDHFDNIEESRKRWVKSQAIKDDIDESIAKYDGKWEWESPQRIVWKDDIGLVLKSQAKHAAIASRLLKEFTFKDDKPLVVQYEVTMQNGQDCGGSYIKLLSSGKQTEDLTKFNDKSPYTIMFGPDKCGNDIKMHFIFRHVNPINGSISEKHSKKPKERLEEPFKDKLPHLYRLVVNPDNTYQVFVDHKVVIDGSLLTDFTPSVNPPQEIDDPEDIKPENWDEREKIPDPAKDKPEEWDEEAPQKIPDPNAVKPDGWLDDEPPMIPDSNALKPDDWDNDIDGEWEAPLVDNPLCENAPGCGEWTIPLINNKDYKGKWYPPLIDNPNYQGRWAARKIPNPDYFEDQNPFKMTPISAVGLELWSMSSDILFDNLIITDDVVVAQEFAAKTFDIKRKYIDRESETLLNRVVTYGTDHPWAWRILLVLIVAPLAFLLYRVCGSKTTVKEPEIDAKKTDEIQPDDVDDDVTNGNDATQQKNSSPKKKKSDLEVKFDETEAEKGNSSDVDRRDSIDSNAGATAAAAATVDAEDYEEETDETVAKSTGARKRRVRKDLS